MDNPAAFEPGEIEKSVDIEPVYLLKTVWIRTRKESRYNFEIRIAVFIHVLYPLEAVDRYACRITAKPHEDTIRISENKVHSLNLVALLFIILLVDTKRICP